MMVRAENRAKKDPAKGFGIILSTVVATVVLVSPVFALGALSELWRAEFSVPVIGVGYGVAAYRLSNGFLSPFVGRLVDRAGPWIGLTTSFCVISIGTFMIGTSRTSVLLFVGCAISGIANAIGQPSVNVLLARRASENLGISMGIKQSAQPLAATLAGGSVVVAEMYGWRSIFVIIGVTCVLLAAVFGALAYRRGRQSPAVNRRGVSRSALDSNVLGLTGAFGLVAIGNSVTLAYFVGYAVDGGMSVARAGLLLAIASTAAIVTRVGLGWMADRMVGRHWELCGGLVVTGGLGVFTMALGGEIFSIVGIILTLIGTWGFNGLFWFSLLKDSPLSAGSITGMVAPGASIGSSVGPVAFGWLTSLVGYSVSWLFVGVSVMLGAIMMVVFGRRRAYAS